MILLASGYQTALDPPGWRAEPRFFNLRWQVAIKTSVAVAKYGFSPERWRRLGELVGVSQIWRRYPLSSSRFKLRFPCATTRLEKPLWTREMLETCQKKKTAEIRNPAFHGLGFAPNGKVNYRRSCNGSLYHMDRWAHPSLHMEGWNPWRLKNTWQTPLRKKIWCGTNLYMSRNGGFHSHGGTLKYGWFISVKISWKIPIQNGFFWG